MNAKYKSLIFFLIALFYIAASNAQSVNKHLDTSDKDSTYQALLERLNEDPDDLDNLKALVLANFNVSNFEATKFYLWKIIQIGTTKSDRDALLYASVRAGQIHLYQGNIDSMNYYMNRSVEMARSMNDYLTLGHIYNILGLHSLFYERDSAKAIALFMDGLSHVNFPEDKVSFGLMNNLAIALFYRKDPEGIKYGLQAYEAGVEAKDDNHTYSASITLAHLYSLTEEYELALKYIKVAAELLPRQKTGQSNIVYNLYGNISLALGNEAKALECYEIALSNAREDNFFSGTDIYLSYGNYYISKGKYHLAIQMLQKGLDVSMKVKNFVNLYLFHQSLAECYERMGNDARALQHYKLYHAESDSLFSLDKAREVAAMKMRYEAEKHAKEMAENNMVLAHTQKRLQRSLLVTIIVTMGIGMVYYQYRRRTVNYKKLLKQHLEISNKESWYLQQISELSESEKPKVKYRGGTLGDERINELFNLLENKMRAEQIFRIKDLTREKVASMLSTNRTYLTRVISENTGLSFGYYINSFRINEAVKILSDSENQIPLKALSSDLGFSSISTFYRFFQAATGMTPSQFRAEKKTP